MKRPFEIHIGTEKTGSTAIQKYLQLNRDALLSQHGVLIPHSLGDGTSVNLAAACQLGTKSDSLRTMRSLHTTNDVEHYYQELSLQLKQELDAKQPQRLVLSCENFSSRLKTDKEVEKLHDFIAPFAEQIRILVYLRRQDAMMVSAYTTKVRNGFKGRFSFPEEGIERHDSHYDKLLERWARVFGEDAISVRLFEHERLHKSDVVSDFCQAVDIPDDLVRPAQRENKSPSADLLEIVRLLNWYVPHQVDDKANPLRGNIVDLVTGTSAAAKLPPLQVDDPVIWQRYLEGNRKIAKHWFPHDSSVPTDLFQPLTTVVAPSSGAEEVELDEAQLIAVCASLWNSCQSELRDTRLQRDCIRAELLIERGKLAEARQLLVRLTRHYPGADTPVTLLADLDEKTAD